MALIKNNKLLRKNVTVFATKERRNKAVLKRTRKNNDIVFGGQSINAQIGIFGRPTTDFDIFTAEPKGSAQAIEKKFDKIVGFDHYYTKKGVNPGTWKVKSKGADLKKGTDDDIGVVDYTKTPIPRPKSKNINGVNFRVLKEEIAGKKRAIRDPEFAFRHEKDSRDLGRIEASGVTKRSRKFSMLKLRSFRR